MRQTDLPISEIAHGGAALDAGPFEVVLPWFETAAALIDLLGIAIILFGVGIATLRMLGGLIKGVGLRREPQGMEEARAVLAPYILTGLEFLIASDIIHTVITRELNDLLFVGLLVIIRTVIAYFLGKEIEALHKKSQPD